MFFSPDYYLKLFTFNVISNLDCRILCQFAVSLSHVVVDLLVAYGVFLAEGKGG